MEFIWLGRQFVIVDTGGLTEENSNIAKHIRQQVIIAIEEAQTILFLVDVTSKMTKEDADIARFLRKFLQNRRIILVVNKADNYTRSDPENLAIFKRLGFGDPFPISATHGIGVGDLLDEIIKV